MTVFIIRRLMQSILVVFVMSFLVFGGVNIVGDPVEMMVNDEADQAERERVIQVMGLDQPWYVQYGKFVTNAMHGDLGKSFVYGEESLGIIVQRMPATFELALAALL
ncbi:MAG: ABC transporter permease, partial [Rhodospirillaceae bacterium]